MKKSIFLSIIITLTIFFGCSTNNDSNGNNTNNAAPSPPSNLKGAVYSVTQINLSWTDNSMNETGFKIERKTLTGSFEMVGYTSNGVVTFIDTGLIANTIYIYRVNSYNSYGNSITFSNEINLTTTVPTALNISGPTVTDVDGNVYETVTNGNQNWTKSNLIVSHYRNGDIIPQVSDTSTWANLTTGARCYYDNTFNGCTPGHPGKLYNWYAVNDPRGIAPEGFHIPSNEEWDLLTNFLSTRLPNESVGDNMKKNSLNHSGYSGLMGGFRGYEGLFYSASINGQWWSKSELNQTAAWYFFLNSSYSGTDLNYYNKTYGFSVRCVKD